MKYMVWQPEYTVASWPHGIITHNIGAIARLCIAASWVISCLNIVVTGAEAGVYYHMLAYRIITLKH
jgi:hypothetical protein